MSIRSRIKSIENHLSNAYNSIINLGLYENNTNKNMENISPLLDEFYNKVSDKTDLNQNGVVGRTSQETITEEAGTNVINTSIYIDDVNTDKEHIIELKGNTSQYTTTGKNLFDKDNLNIITDKYLNDSGDEINDNNFSISDYIRVEPNTIYSSQPYENKSACICFYNSSKTFLSSVRLTTVNPNFTTPNDCVYIRSSLFKADIDNIQIEKGSTASDYEPFTGNQSSPNPDYPQDVQVVTGDNGIKVEGKNLFNINGVVSQGTLVKYNNGITLTKNVNRYCRIDLPQMLPAGTYTISLDVISSNLSSNTAFGINIQNLNVPGYTIQTIHPLNPVTFTITDPFEKLYFYIANSESDSASITIDNIQLEKGSTASTYTPYVSQTYPVNLTSKNISNWMQGLINSSGVFLDSQLAISTDFIPVKNGDTFTAQKNTTFTGTNDNMTCRLYDTNKNYLASIFTLGYDNLTQTITLNNADVAYVRFTQFRQDGLLVNNNYEIMVEKGSTATSYVPYFEPIELCKIGDYQDRIYKQNDKWYLEKKIDKNFENSFTYINPITSTLANNLYGYACNTRGLSSYSELGAIISNIFVPKILGSQTDTTNPNNVRFNMGIAKHPNSNQVIITIDKKYLDTGTTTEFSNFLNNNDFEYYCVLSTPTTTEITDTTLVNQLNALYNATIYPITNINTDTSNLIPYIDLIYNKVTPSPSPDRPSEVQNLSGDISYKITGKNKLNPADFNTTEAVNGISTLANQYYLQLSGTPTGTNRAIGTNLDITNIVKNLNTVTFSFSTISGEYPYSFRLYVRDATSTIVERIDTATKTITYTDGYTYTIAPFILSTATVSEINCTLALQLEQGSTATSYEPYISRTYQIKLGNIELCKINTYEDKIYSNDGKFYLEKNIGKVVLDGSQSESWSYTNVSQGSLFRNSTIITNEITNKNYSPYSNYYKCIPENNYLNRQNNELYIQSTNNYLDIIDNRFTSANDFKTWLSTHNTILYYALATPTTTEITSDNYPELYESLKQIQDYLVQYKINNEFILDYSSPNIEY